MPFLGSWLNYLSKTISLYPFNIKTSLIALKSFLRKNRPCFSTRTVHSFSTKIITQNDKPLIKLPVIPDFFRSNNGQTATILKPFDRAKIRKIYGLSISFIYHGTLLTSKYLSISSIKAFTE